MFKIIKTEYYDEFRCLMDECKDNCCDEDWIITIDDEVYEKYKSLGIDNLEEKITKDNHSIIKKNGKCPFILENGLCYWHKEYGEDYLSNTCKSYPRFVSSYGDLYIQNIGLSCPASATWVVNLDHKCKIIDKIYFEDVNEITESYKKSSVETLMMEILKYFYTSDSFFDAIKKTYLLLGDEVNISSDNPLLTKNDLVFCNISICFLFEHIMLESKNEYPDYISTINQLCEIIGKIEDKYLLENDSNNEKERLINSIYKTMRKEDHKI